MRVILVGLACLLPSAALAEDIVARADIRAATVYAGSAEVTRVALAEIPQGDHRLLLAVPNAQSINLPQVTASGGVEIGQPSVVQSFPITLGALDTPQQAAARAAVEAQEDALQALRDEISLLQAERAALTLQISYLESLAGGGETGPDQPADAGALAASLAALGAERARLAGEVQASQEAERALTEEIEEAGNALRAAQFALGSLQPFGATVDMIALDISAEAAGEVAIDLRHGWQGATWSPRYDLSLSSETGALTLARHIDLSVPGGEAWRDVEVTFSTADPNRPLNPQQVSPDPARIHDPVMPSPTPMRGGIAEEAMMDGMVAPMEPVMVEAVVVSSGLSLSYDYQSPVSVGPSGRVTLPFDDLAFDTELTNIAVPRRDSTAFLTAAFTNDSGEPLLPGEARFFRDGDLVGESWLPMIAAGAEAELAFGPLDHLILTWQDLSLNEGDRGLFVQSSTQDRSIAFTVENTSDTGEEVRVLYATPFAEQEDLDLDLSLSPQPDETDVDDLRGVVAWDVTVAAGETQRFTMDVGLNWPEGQVLGWRP